MRRRWLTIGLLTIAVGRGRALAQTNQYVPYVPTGNPVVDAMLKLAEVDRDDLVYDLGSGDGRIVIKAAKDFGARGVGVDIDPELIEKSRKNALEAGVSDRVQFFQQDLFTLDLRPATVVTLYLFPEVNKRLRPLLFQQLKPGTAVVSNEWDMGEWQADKTLRVSAIDRPYMLYSWMMPAEAAGVWQWKQGQNLYLLKLDQRFQQVSGVLTIDGNTASLSDLELKGDQLRFTAARATQGRASERFEGRLQGATVRGTLTRTGATEVWQAERTAPGTTPWFF